MATIVPPTLFWSNTLIFIDLFVISEQATEKGGRFLGITAG
jgi:hypothetical protein